MVVSCDGRPLVLIVEDDLFLRFHAVDIISRAGFHVLEAASADEAISILENHEDISVVFTDIQMPGRMDGLKLAAAVRDRWPPVAIIATSGLLDIRDTDLPSGSRFIAKPYRDESLIAHLRALTV